VFYWGTRYDAVLTANDAFKERFLEPPVVVDLGGKDNPNHKLTSTALQMVRT
jgi:hypothetical protein